MTSAVMAFIKCVLRVPLRMSEIKLLKGDEEVHGEEAYTFRDIPDVELGVMPPQIDGMADQRYDLFPELFV